MSVGNWLAGRRAPRIALIAGLFILPLVFVVSAAIVCFISQAQGWRQALADCLLALVVVIVVTVVAGDDWWIFAASAAGLWFAAAALGGLAGKYQSLAFPIQSAVVAGMAGIGIFYIVVEDATAFGERFLKDQLMQLEQAGLKINQPELLLEQASNMVGSIVGSMIFFLLLALLIGSRWAGKTGSRPVLEMFIQIRLGYVVGGVAAVSGVAAMLGLGSLPGNLLLVAAVGFLFQGLSVVYWHGTVRKWPGPWFLLLFLPLLLGTQLTVMWIFVLVAVGFMDNWYGLRRGPADVV